MGEWIGGNGHLSSRFHPNQIAHALMAEVLWNHLMNEHPTFLGAENPNNAQILQLFGDQGGY